MRLQFSIAATLFSLVGATHLQEAGAKDIFPTTRSLAEQTKIPFSTFDCTNDDTFRQNGKKKKDCDWVAKKSKRRCRGKDNNR